MPFAVRRKNCTVQPMAGTVPFFLCGAEGIRVCSVVMQTSSVNFVSGGKAKITSSFTDVRSGHPRLTLPQRQQC